MRAELRLVNALIGMSVGGGRWPTLLRDLGYRLSALQSAVSVDEGDGRGFVVPEAVFYSLDEKAVLPVESKSATFEARQGRRYWALTIDDLKAHGLIPDDVAVDAVVAPTYFCDRNNTAALKAAIGWFNTQEWAELPLVDYNHKRFELQCGSIRSPRLNDNFASGIYFDEVEWPTRFLRFDFESPDHEIVRPLAQELMFLLRDEQVTEFTADHLAGGHPATQSDGFIPHYEKFGADARKRWRVRIVFIVEELRVNYLNDVISRKAGEQAWVQEGSVDSPRRMRSMQERVQDYIGRKERGEPLRRQTQTPPLVGQEMLEEDEY